MNTMRNMRFHNCMRRTKIGCKLLGKSMSSAEYLPLALFVIVSTITPGGATTLATASGAHFGYRRSLPLISGIAIGLGSMAASAAAGIGGIILAFPSLQIAMKVLGTLYLMWLAYKMTLSGSPRQQTAAARPTGFVSAIWLVWHNPKGWAMTLGAAASFAALSAVPWYLGMLLGMSFVAGATISLSLWCLAGLLLARLLKTDTQWRVLNFTLGLLLAVSIIPMWM
jgi:threonine/homoserine/homoserine lactone efflux protein